VRGGDALIAVRVRPRSSHSGVTRGSDGGLVVCVHAPASEGAANRECAAVLAKTLRVPKSAVRIVRGQSSRSKHIAVAGMTGDQARARLQQAASGEQRAP
jgi:uncharacterized protein (TIGR00251 family)